MKRPTEAKPVTKRLVSKSGQREALPDSGSHQLFNTLLLADESLQLGDGLAKSLGRA